jgi:hypothetical protein
MLIISHVDAMGRKNNWNGENDIIIQAQHGLIK